MSLYSGSSAERVLALLLRPDRGGHQEATVLRRRDRAETSGHGKISRFGKDLRGAAWPRAFG